MDFEKERLMLSKEEARKRAKELFNENQADLITKYMFLEQQVKKQKEVIDKAIEYINNHDLTCNENWLVQYEKELLDILKEVAE